MVKNKHVSPLKSEMKQCADPQAITGSPSVNHLIIRSQRLLYVLKEIVSSVWLLRPSTQRVEAGGFLGVGGQPGIHNEC